MDKQNLSQIQYRIRNTNGRYGQVTVSATVCNPWLGALPPESSSRHTPEVGINERLLRHPTCHSTLGGNQPAERAGLSSTLHRPHHHGIIPATLNPGGHIDQT
jgi:hypothetical protein